MKTLDDFRALVSFYKMKADSGVYYNPYDVDNELLEILRHIKFESIDEKETYEDIAYDTASLFWSM